MGIVPIYIPNQAYAISPFYPYGSLTIFVYYKHSSEAPTTYLAVWVQPPLPLCYDPSVSHG